MTQELAAQKWLLSAFCNISSRIHTSKTVALKTTFIKLQRQKRSSMDIEVLDEEPPDHFLQTFTSPRIEIAPARSPETY